MALPDYPTLVAGAPVVWAPSGGDQTLTLTSLANGAAREGPKVDFASGTYGLPEALLIRLETAVASAATAGTTIEVYLGFSTSTTAGTDNPANLSGTDASLSNPDELKYQAVLAGVLVLSNAMGTSVQKTYLWARPLARAVIPLVINKSGQALSSTASDHKLVITPYYRQIQD